MQMKIYISSTFADLEQHREKVYRALRALRHDVIAMEDYVAADKRPLEQCLEDVRGADIYVGIFAWRYGYVPKTDNPEKKSITELEMREAERFEKPRLIFLLKDDALWRPTMSDMGTGDNEGGARIKALREELKQDRLAGMFETPEDLAIRVVTAVGGWQMESSITEPIAVTRPGARATPRKRYPNLWVPGSKLRIRFLEGSASLQRRVLRFAQLWSAYANVSFEAKREEGAEVRIAFRERDGAWAYLGTDSLKVPHDEPTINFAWLHEDSSVAEFEGQVVSSFGRVLGLLNEHNNPDAAIRWNKKKVYKTLGAPPNLWSKDNIDGFFFWVWSRDAFPIRKPFDPDSIMASPLPSEFTLDGLSMGRSNSISPGDKEFVSRLYPYDEAAMTEAKTRNTIANTK
jgi:hypothetical protein